MAPKMWAGVRGSGEHLRLSMGFDAFEGSRSNLELRVLPLTNSDCFLAVTLSRVATRFPSASGFSVTGPSDRRVGATQANALMAVYPRTAELEGVMSTDLTYTPSPEAERPDL